MTYTDVVKSIPGLTHYYPLNAEYKARDAVGGLDGRSVGTVSFATSSAKFNGSSYIELPDNNDFSVSTTGSLTMVAFLTIDNWARTVGNAARVYWMGKFRQQGELEWTLAHYYSPDPSGENRAKRISVYHNNLTSVGAAGVGHYFQDSSLAAGTEVLVTAVWNRTPFYIDIYRDGVLRGHQTNSQPPDSRNRAITFSGTSGNGSSPVRLGQSNTVTGGLVGQLRRVAFYKRALTAAEISKLYAARSQSDGSSPVPAPVPAPVPPWAISPDAPLSEMAASYNALLAALKTKGVL